MDKIDEKTRLMCVLRGGKTDRPPVICPGGMMNAAVSEIVRDIEGNHNVSSEAMVIAAKKIRKVSGFENYGVPFCMTVESEPFGVKLDFGNKNREPVVTEYNKMPVEGIMEAYQNINLDNCRIPEVLKALKELKNDSVPVIGNITGAVSTATSIVDPLVLLKMMRKEPERAYKFIEFINGKLIEYALQMLDSGADVIAVSDPTATGEILGKTNFEKFAVPMFKKMSEEVHNAGASIIIHICGDTTNIVESLCLTGADAYSFDSIVSIKNTKPKLNAKIMGNVSTQLLQEGSEEQVAAYTAHCMESGSDIIAPACGLGMSTPVKNLKAMTSYVKGEKFNAGY